MPEPDDDLCVRLLLLGGTSESGVIAARLADSGYDVLLSAATDEPMEIAASPRIRRRCGRLDAAGLAELARAESIRAIIDATHPYAAAAHEAAIAAADTLGIPCLRFVRGGGIESPADQPIDWAADHAEAARIAFSLGRPVLLTTGATHLADYVEQSRRTGVALAVRVLPRAESVAACEAAGVPASQVITGKGPFSVADNREHIRRFNAAVLVTKDSGDAGGVPAKLAAARLEGCRVVVIRRPVDASRDEAFTSIGDLVATVARRFSH